MISTKNMSGSDRENKQDQSQSILNIKSDSDRFTPYYETFPSGCWFDQGTSQTNFWELLPFITTRAKEIGVISDQGQNQESSLKGPLVSPYQSDLGQSMSEFKQSNWKNIGQQYQTEGWRPWFGIFGKSEALPPEEIQFCQRLGFEFIKELGRGAFGSVWSVSYTTYQGTQQLACKILNLKTYAPRPISDALSGRKPYTLKEAILQLLKEADIHKTLIHRNVVKCEHIFKIHDQNTGFPYCRLLMFMELCQGDLYSLIQNSPKEKISENEAKVMLRDVSAGLQCLHDNNVCHFDIKPQNIMYVNEGGAKKCYKLADFGISRRFKSRNSDLVGMRGTLAYIAPEMSNTVYFRPKPTDVYSLGCVLAEAVFGTLWWRRRIDVLLDCRGEGRDVHRICSNDNLSKQCVKIIVQMTNLDPNQRPNIAKVLKDPWLSDGSAQPSDT